jgi:thiamine-phosphate pyrophosphorylase
LREVALIVPDLTPAAARALAGAALHAKRLNAAQVRSLHLLAGLLAEEESRACQLLSKAGVDLAQFGPWRERVALLEETVPAELLPSYGPDVEAALRRASEMAAEVFCERTVGSEALLLGLLEEDGHVQMALQHAGLVPVRLEDLVNALRPAPLELSEPLQLHDSSAQMSVGRILDANANRAREALRVVEDYCRFVLEDRFLSAETKQLRHDLRTALEALPPGTLLASRDTEGDVGTSVSTVSERQRQSPLHVVEANLKRLQEALRSLEEYGKVRSPALGQSMEQLRYRSYTVERAILMGQTVRARLADARLYVLLTAASCRAALDWTIQEAAAGGASIFQLREKGLDDRDLLTRARKVRKWTRDVGALFILNDRPDLAVLADADGVHLGQEDMPVRDARRIVGPDVLVGVSTHRIDQLRQAVRDGASYVGIGPTFPSGTKTFDEFPGVEFVREAAEETSLPAFVIGGVTLGNVEGAVAAGGQRVAVSAAICQADEPRRVAAAFLQALAVSKTPG